ncbi:MAG: hypothetical protein R2854_30700 [Caldilineaceae bacterium]
MLDRLLHAVDVALAWTGAGDRAEVLRRRIFFEQDPDSFIDAHENMEEEP